MRVCFPELENHCERTRFYGLEEVWAFWCIQGTERIEWVLVRSGRAGDDGTGHMEGEARTIPIVPGAMTQASTAHVGIFAGNPGHGWTAHNKTGLFWEAKLQRCRMALC